MMDLEKILKLVQTGDLDVEEAKKQIIKEGSAAGPANLDLGFAQLDIDREKRTGFPEVIFGEGKTAEQIEAIFRRLMEHTDRVLATRVDAAKAAHVTADVEGVTYHETARSLTWFKRPTAQSPRRLYRRRVRRHLRPPRGGGGGPYGRMPGQPR